MGRGGRRPRWRADGAMPARAASVAGPSPRCEVTRLAMCCAFCGHGKPGVPRHCTSGARAGRSSSARKHRTGAAARDGWDHTSLVHTTKSSILFVADQIFNSQLGGSYRRSTEKLNTLVGLAVAPVVRRGGCAQRCGGLGRPSSARCSPSLPDLEKPASISHQTPWPRRRLSRSLCCSS